MDRIMILTNTLPEESNISVNYKGDVAVVVARDNQERLPQLQQSLCNCRKNGLWFNR